mmetsp:Transcript_104016/g.335400  ORF Transcript_104016/g.335400 Transcript_104016/m.335400 type:complete len:576 (+) Transcript_104016:161-1888(+)
MYPALLLVSLQVLAVPRLGCAALLGGRRRAELQGVHASGDAGPWEQGKPDHRAQGKDYGGPVEQQPAAVSVKSTSWAKELPPGVLEDMERRIKRDIKKELRTELGIPERAHEDVEEQIEEEVKQDLAEEGIGIEERMSPLGQSALEKARLEDKWEYFQWAVVFIVLLALVIGCLCYLAPDPVNAEFYSEETVLEVCAPPGDTRSQGGAQYFHVPIGVTSALCFTLVAMPIGLASRLFAWSGPLSFGLNLLAIIPESFLLGIATEELALHMGDAAGAFLNASFGNAVELIFVYFTLEDGLLDACTGSLVGSILSNNLVLLGFSFLVGGVLVTPRRKIRLSPAASFDRHGALDQAQQLLLASFGMTLPALFAKMHHVTLRHVLTLSRAFSLFLLLSYIALIFYQLHSRPSPSTSEQPEKATLNVRVSLALLAISTAVMAVSSECMVLSLDDFCHSIGLSQTFVGMVLLPIAGDLSHMSAVYFAMKGKMDLSISIALASAIQIALVVTPFSVVFGQFVGQPMTLEFHSVHSVTIMISAIITFAVLVDGQSSWLRGYTLLTTFVLICLVIFFMPDHLKE